MANWDNIKGLFDHKHTTSEIIGLNLISAGLDFQGVYNPLTTYTVAQYVQYNGSIYVSTIETTGNLPTNTNYWTLFISKGDKGEEGTPGSNGINGLDAYQIALNNGFEGTVIEWLDSLHGANGSNGTNGTNGTNGVDGEDGLSAYQIAVNNGFVGDVSAWLNSLKGANGNNGNDGNTGPQGISAYQSAVNGGFVGTEEEWLESLHGADGVLPEANLRLFNMSDSTNTIDFLTDYLLEDNNYLANTAISGGNKTITISNPVLNKTVTVSIPALGATTVILLPTSVDLLLGEWNYTQRNILMLHCVNTSPVRYHATITQSNLA